MKKLSAAIFVFFIICSFTVNGQVANPENRDTKSGNYRMNTFINALMKVFIR